ncbi:hypothetical protein, partial [Klebsiella pneumoniae]
KMFVFMADFTKAPLNCLLKPYIFGKIIFGKCSLPPRVHNSMNKSDKPDGDKNPKSLMGAGGKAFGKKYSRLAKLFTQCPLGKQTCGHE